ncbi:hypothetical protein MG293_015055 [Ovis ammon polii]|uniref:Uncharacterized protein n=1 Tax=Ovis ammon polii TaxID=230172 RepID=A0AAD4TXU6_OVIAM|nr:hypothetical protein MG293_015055 [Ovis ammon polii]
MKKRGQGHTQINGQAVRSVREAGIPKCEVTELVSDRGVQEPEEKKGVRWREAEIKEPGKEQFERTKKKDKYQPHHIERKMNQCGFCLGNEFSVKGSCPILFVTVLQHNPVCYRGRGSVRKNLLAFSGATEYEGIDKHQNTKQP